MASKMGIQSALNQDEKVWTVKEVLNSSANYLNQSGGSETPRLDAELLLADALECKRIDLYINFDRPLNEAERAKMRGYLKRRCSCEPVAYILGYKEFFGKSFKVNNGVLIPRPDSEQLVLTAIDIVDGLSRENEKIRVLDVGAGSGCLGISLASQMAKVTVKSWDIDEKAITVAQENAERHNVADRYKVECVDARIPESYENCIAAFDLIISNPPYISEQEFAQLASSVKDYEPVVALSDRGDGLTFYKALASNAWKLAPIIAVEIGAKQAASVSSIFSEQGWHVEKVIADLAGCDRVIVARRGSN